MDLDKYAGRARALADHFRVEDGRAFDLGHCDPADTLDFDAEDKPLAKEMLNDGVEALAAFQEMLYAQDRWAVLCVFQAMDAAGKDSAIKHVLSGVNPQGCHVTSFKAPSAEELDHDFLWRCTRQLPERGRIGIFNRSYYEEVLIVRVHAAILAAQKLPKARIDDDIWAHRFTDICNYEAYLARQGIAIAKFFLHVSKEEQKQRFLARIDDPKKNWKFAPQDVAERAHWDDYMHAYEEAIRRTAAPHAPWYVVPADKKWFARTVVAAAIVDTVHRLGVHFPELDDAGRKALATGRRTLLAEED